MVTSVSPTTFTTPIPSSVALPVPGYVASSYVTSVVNVTTLSTMAFSSSNVSSNSVSFPISSSAAPTTVVTNNVQRQRGWGLRGRGQGQRGRGRGQGSQSGNQGQGNPPPYRSNSAATPIPIILPPVLPFNEPVGPTQILPATATTIDFYANV